VARLRRSPEPLVGVVVRVLEPNALAVAEIPAVDALVLSGSPGVLTMLPRQDDSVTLVREHVEDLDLQRPYSSIIWPKKARISCSPQYVPARGLRPDTPLDPLVERCKQRPNIAGEAPSLVVRFGDATAFDCLDAAIAELRVVVASVDDDDAARGTSANSPRGRSATAFGRRRFGGSQKQQCFALSTISASTPSMVVSWTTPGGSSPERRRTVGILTPLLSGGRSPKLTGAGSPSTAPNGRLRSAGRSQRRQPAAQRLDDW
jgi:hypothetical protein